MVQIGSGQDVCFRRDAAGFLPQSGSTFIVQVREFHPDNNSFFAKTDGLCGLNFTWQLSM